MKKRVQKKRVAKRGIFISSAFGLCGAILILISLLAIFSLVGLATDNPHSLLSPISFFSIYTASFFGGFIAIKKNKSHDPLLCGLVCGSFIALSYSLVFGLIGIILDIKSTPISWLYRLLMIVSALIGALLGTATRNKTPKRRKMQR